jgi:hypothetical protein
MIPAIYARFARSQLAHQWTPLVAFGLGVIICVLLVFARQLKLAFILAGPIVLLPWVLFLACYQFRAGLKRSIIWSWFNAAILDCLLLVALIWPFIGT